MKKKSLQKLKKCCPKDVKSRQKFVKNNSVKKLV
jgi:hypothetical protein